MTSFFRKRAIRYPLTVLSILGVMAAVLLLLSQFWLGLLFSVLFLAVMGFTWKMEEQTYIETEKHIETLSYRVKKVGEEALLELPIGIILINDKNTVEWANPYAAKIFAHQETLIGNDLFDLSGQFHAILKSEKAENDVLTIGEQSYKVFYKAEERLIYLFDITEQLVMETLYYADRTVLGIILVDNYDEVSQAMDDQTRSQLNSLVTSLVNSWGTTNGIFVKRIATDRFLAVFNEATLANLEKTKFSILDDIRETTAKQSTALTLSIGVGVGYTSLIELGELAQSSLDLGTWSRW